MSTLTITIAYSRTVQTDATTGLNTGYFKWTASSTVNGEALTGVALSKSGAKQALLTMVTLALADTTTSENVPVYTS